jgi:hypothetical protein
VPTTGSRPARTHGNRDAELAPEFLQGAEAQRVRSHPQRADVVENLQGLLLERLHAKGRLSGARCFEQGRRVGGVGLVAAETQRLANQHSNWLLVRRWISAMRHPSPATASWKTDFAKATATVVAFVSDPFRLDEGLIPTPMKTRARTARKQTGAMPSPSWRHTSTAS